MNTAKSYFAKFFSFKAPQSSVLRVFREGVLEILHVTIAEDALTYDSQTKSVRIKATGPLRQEILMRRDALLAHCRMKLGKDAPNTIS